MSENKQYENEYKVQAVKLAKKIGAVKAANELQIPVNTLYGWIRKVKIGSLDIGCGERSPEESLNIVEENQQLRKRIKALEKENKRLSEMNAFLEDAAAFFRCQPSEIGKEQRLMYIAIRTDDGRNIGKISFYCSTLQVSRQAFYDYLERKGKPWKYQPLADAILKIHDEDEENADYGRVRMYQALKYRKEVGKLDGIKIPCEATVRSVMEQINLIHKPKRKPNGITKADREARKSDDLLKRDFTADAPLKKCVTNITEIKAKDGKLYVSAIFDCYDLMPNGLAMADHMRAELCCETLKNASLRYPEICGAIVHSDRGSQYASSAYRTAIQKYGIVQSMNSAGGRCHDNARCESIWARMKEELFYNRGRRSEDYTIEALKTMVWRYFMSYWSNRRICSAIGGIPPAVKRRRFYSALTIAA